MDSETPSKKLTIGECTSEDLAAYVVVYRTLGINKKLAITCMAELGRRRDLGEDFNFEEFIEEEIKKIPKIPDMDLVRIASNISSNIKGAGSAIAGNNKSRGDK